MGAKRLKRIAVVGAGTMGHGFAQVFAAAGHSVALNDLNEEILDSALRRISSNLDIFIAQGVLRKAAKRAILGRITVTTDLGRAAESADFVLEAVPELLEIKRDIFRRLDQAAPKRALLASTTSGLSMTKISSRTSHPERAVITHGTNPPYIIPIVEIVRGRRTSETAVRAASRLLRGAGMMPLVLQKEVPGFLFNRLQFALFREALYCLERGIARAEDIDLAVRTGYGFRLAHLGPCETADFGGLDTFCRISDNLFPVLSSAKRCPDLLRRLVDNGCYGIKSGRGFGRWPAEKIRRRLAERDVRLLHQLKLMRVFEK